MGRAGVQSDPKPGPVEAVATGRVINIEDRSDRRSEVGPLDYEGMGNLVGEGMTRGSRGRHVPVPGTRFAHAGAG